MDQKTRAPSTKIVIHFIQSKLIKIWNLQG